jgi:tetratricopeptide (TPR) repeat protein
MTNSDTSIFQAGDIARFKRHARTGLLMTLAGMVIVISAFAYSGWALVAMQKQLEDTRKSAGAAKVELDQIQQRVKESRLAYNYLQSAFRQYSLGDYKGAVELYDKVLETDPENQAVLNMRGYALLRSGDAQGAIASLEKSVSLAPNYVWGHYNLALAYGKDGQMDKAMQHIKTLIELRPAMAKALQGDGQFKIFKNIPAYQALIGQG